MESREREAVERLRALHDGDDFATLPDELQQRVREIVAESRDA